MTMRTQAGLVLVALLAVAGCSGDDDDDTSPAPAPTTASTTTTHADGGGFVALHGNATLDGAPLDAEFLGAIVADQNGLVTPCQAEIPAVAAGAYDITVLTDAASAGCGEADTEIVLWTFANDTRLYATTAIPWPSSSSASDTTHDVTFALDTPLGATTEAADFTGLVYDADGQAVATGTRVEAYVGDTLCGVAGVRDTGEYTGYILAVVGEDAVPGCTRGADLSFTVDGQPATETAPNEPGRRDSLDLHVAS